MTGWEARHEPFLTVRPPERVDPGEAALIARLEAAGWTVVDRRAWEDVTIVVSCCDKRCVGEGVHAGPTAVWALTEACEAVGA